MKSLHEIWADLAANGMGSDKGDVHSYLPLYEEILSPYRDTAMNVLEVGLFNGHSLRMWNEYFILARVFGIDCDLKPHGGLADLSAVIEDGYNVLIGDATNPMDISKFFTGIKFDVVIEDAAHDVRQQVQIYKTLKPYLSENALYIIEDIQDIDGTREIFEDIDPEKKVDILDRRHIKGRYDDTIVIIQTK